MNGIRDPSIKRASRNTSVINKPNKHQNNRHFVCRHEATEKQTMKANQKWEQGSNRPDNEEQQEGGSGSFSSDSESNFEELNHQRDVLWQQSNILQVQPLVMVPEVFETPTTLVPGRNEFTEFAAGHEPHNMMRTEWPFSLRRVLIEPTRKIQNWKFAPEKKNHPCKVALTLALPH